ncbi:polysaccharide lyase family 7 protein [Marinomonas sp. C2222]|uniref:Polysaccharide lyase family 7 protein n=1 Tax=Marinomonas sargassi TaxID=2984494 RepID=A0ABT2YRB3_9GAMM|nr:polysaccharide lyase family 7 protein [Marinomonas sargassi]MCV2402420.1 polysaccharide lyase family 7 protein [Marinomonas sargassi]
MKKSLALSSFLLLSIPLSGLVEAATAPSTKFDLLNWKLSVPVDEDGNGKADDIKEKKLNGGYVSPEFFYLSEDGGMVFKAPIAGAKTSKNTTYTRSELREMIRRGNTKHKTTGVTGNNWVFSTAPEEDQKRAGGVDGSLEATLAVDYVTTTGKDYQVGRVVIGQIHANHNEPIRIYYRKLPNNMNGSLYYAHEPTKKSGRKEIFVEMIGSKSNSARNPADGIALGEKFSYRIDVVGNTLTVTIMRPGKPDVVSVTDMDKSGYDKGGLYMYFKAGVYNQNKSGDGDDYVQATFYDLKVTH